MGNEAEGLMLESVDASTPGPDWSPTPETLAQWERQCAAYQRGELPYATLEEVLPIMDRWLRDLDSVIALREAEGVPEGVAWQPPGGAHDGVEDLLALPFRTRQERQRAGELW